MNIITPPLNQSSCRRESQRCQFSASVGFLALLVFLISLTVVAQEPKPPATNTAETQMTENTGQKADTTENTDTTSEMTKEKITGTADRMERYDKEGITILIGNAKTVRYNAQGVEIGFLNADKITMKSDPVTDTTIEIIAEVNVEIRDQDIFATCDHAIMNNLTNTITLKENVVVLQNKDRLETKLFTFNRTTGKQTGEGGVKFKVSITQAAPVSTETDQSNESGEETGEEKTDAAAPEKTETQAEEGKKDTEAEAENADADAEEKSAPDPGDADSEEKNDTDTENPNDADAGDAEDADSREETDTDTENSDDADTDAETDESEND